MYRSHSAEWLRAAENTGPKRDPHTTSSHLSAFDAPNPVRCNTVKKNCHCWPGPVHTESPSRTWAKNSQGALLERQGPNKVSITYTYVSWCLRPPCAYSTAVYVHLAACTAASFTCRHLRVDSHHNQFPCDSEIQALGPQNCDPEICTTLSWSNQSGQ